jgi:peptidoglycan/LPS O-acetylase OafA/YrhL
LVAVGLTALAMLILAWWFQHTGRAALTLFDPGSAHRWLYRMPLTRIGDFFLGIFAARLYVTMRGRAAAAMVGGWLAVCGVAVIVFFSTQAWMSSSAYAWDVGYAVPGMVVILGLALSPRAPLSRFLSTPPLLLLGEASYAFYLIHFFVATKLGAGSWVLAVAPSTLGLEAMSLGLVLALSIGLHIALERPARIFLRKWLDRRPPRPPTTPGVAVSTDPAPTPVPR